MLKKKTTELKMTLIGVKVASCAKIKKWLKLLN